MYGARPECDLCKVVCCLVGVAVRTLERQKTWDPRRALARGEVKRMRTGFQANCP